MNGEGERVMNGHGFDVRVPNVARVYDYLLGGKDHYEADREFAAGLLETRPDTMTTVRENRAFLGRAVRFLAEQGIRQFLDIGTGLPTADNTHQVAQRINPDSRVVYVDHDPVVRTHAQALLTTNADTVGFVQADLREPDSVLGAPETGRLLDFSQPVAVLMVAILHFILDEDDPHAVVARYVDALSPGSYLVISHAEDAPGIATIAKMYTEHASSAAQARSRAQIARFFDGVKVVEPGIVPVSAWRPTVPRGNPKAWFLAGVGVKPRGPQA